MVRGALAVALSAGLFASPFAALYCSEGDEAAMACCQGDTAECNQPGKTEECCQSAPLSKDSSAVVLAPRLERVLSMPLLDAALPAASILPRPTAASTLRGWSFTVVQDLPPPPTSVLRI